MALETQWSKEHGLTLGREQGAMKMLSGSREHKNLAKGAGSNKKSGNGARSKRNYQGARGKIKKEQGAKKDEKGAVKIGKKERVPENRREQGEQGKMLKGTRDHGPLPLTEPQLCYNNFILFQRFPILCFYAHIMVIYCYLWA